MHRRERPIKNDGAGEEKTKQNNLSLDTRLNIDLVINIKEIIINKHNKVERLLYVC